VLNGESARAALSASGAVLYQYVLLELFKVGDNGEPGSSVRIVSGYGLDDREIEVRFSAEAKGFFL
jgi:hypothetical protein